MMRVAYVCADPGVPAFGRKGASVHVQSVIRALLELGAEVELFATRAGGAPPADLGAVAVHHLPPIRERELAARERSALAANCELRAQLGARPRFDLIYERHSLWSFAAMEYGETAGVPRLLEVNSPLIEEQAAYRGLVNRSAAELVRRRALGAAGCVLAVSEPVARRCRELAGTTVVAVVPNGVDPARFAARQPSRPGSAFTVGFVGTLKPWHGLGTLVDAFALLRARRPDVRLLIVGDGPGHDDLAHDLARRDLDEAATLTGGVAPAAVPELLARMDVGVAPYPPLEPFYFSPLKVLEYMAAGLPVVASRLGEIPRLVNDGETGRLVAPGDPTALRDALAVLEADRGRAWAMGRAGRRRATECHSWHSVVERSLRLAGLDTPRAPQALARAA